MILFDINSSAVVQHTARLERMNRSAMPVVVRQVLSRAAYDVKTVTMPKTSDVFIHRRATFFKANSRVVQAQGFDINSMRAIVGFLPKQNDRSRSVEDLSAQEHGGGITSRSLIALPLARVNNSWKKLVREESFMRRILGHLVDSRKSSSSSEKGRFTKAAVHAGTGGFVISEKITNSGSRIVFLITALNRFGGNTAVQCIPVFSVKRARFVRPKATHFMETASVQSARKAEAFFIELANKKLLKA